MGTRFTLLLGTRCGFGLVVVSTLIPGEAGVVRGEN